jgi:AcrR family transcriptional regulator
LAVNNNSRYKGISKDEILEVAMKLFHAKGYHGTSTAEICQCLGISKPTLYWYFKNKEEILFSAHESLMESLLIPIIKGMEGIDDHLERLKYFINEYVPVICANPKLRILVHESMFLDPEHSGVITDNWRKMLKCLRESLQGLELQGRTKPLNPSFIAMSLIGMCTWPYYWFDYSRPEGMSVLVENIAEMFFQGILK